MAKIISVDKEKINGLSVIVPVYNEEKAVRDTINRIDKTLKKLNISYEIIAVEDCSKDRSFKILKSIEIKSLRIIKHSINKGYGRSLKDGMAVSKYNKICIIDADGSYIPEDISRLIKYARDYDLVTCKRKLIGSGIPLIRVPAKFMLNKFAGYITGKRIDDLNCGLRIFDKKKAMEFWHLYPERFSFTTTMIMAFLTNNYSVKFVPINYLKRKGKSTIKPTDFIRFNKMILKMIIYFNPLKFFIPVSIGLLALAGAVAVVSIYNGKLLDTLVAIIAVLSIQTFFFGLLAEIMAKSKR